ncbi:MAG: amino acid ABC transporter permease [Devosia sp.]|nr:amino acid ABC transporter permease [Devosia sp.]
MSFNWDVVRSSIGPLLQGAEVTIGISLVSMVIATAVGVVLGTASLSYVVAVRWLVRGYVSFVRGVPPLVLILLVYFAPPAFGVDMPSFWAAVLALTVNAGAYTTEIVRAGLVSIDRGQAEAASAIGMTWRGTLLHVLLPQAMRRVIPPLTNELISLIKTTPLLSVISIFELTGTAQAIVAQKFAPLEVYLLLALFYFTIIGALSLFMRYLEWRLPR